MALAYHVGGNSLAAASFDDATGFADDATLIIESGQQAITADLDSGAGLTNGISYLDIRRGYTGQIGGAGASMETKFRSTYTANPQIVLDGATLYLTCTNTCNWILLLSGKLVLVAGTAALVEQAGGELVVAAGATITTLDQAGGEYIDLATSSNAITTGHVAGVAHFRRTVTTANVHEGSSAKFDYTTGPTAVNMYGGRAQLLRGGATTVNGRRGVLDTRAATRDQTIGTLNSWPKFRHDKGGAGATTTVTSLVDKVGGSHFLAETGN